MKKFFALLAIVALLLPSCQKINDRLDAIDNRLDNIEGTQIASLQQQIDAINTTLPELKQMDAELKNYIESLQTTATGLQQQIIYIGEDIDDLEDALDQAVTDAEDADNALKAELISQLQSTKNELEAELTLINSSIETLTAAYVELEQKVTTLEEYVNTELKNTEDWVSATFATLEQYNSICTEVATIKQNIETLTSSITELEERINTKIANDIAAAAATLDATIQAKVTEITNAYTSAISTATDEITEAYTAAIATSIANLESSMKEWVNDQLTGYYTIAETEAALELLKDSITSGDAAFQEIELLSQRLENMKTEIAEAYHVAIETAITENNGIIDSKIASEVATINGRIDQEVATINAKIAEIESRLDNIEVRITELLARIQSVTYVPQYSDGKATMDYNTKSAEFDFIISPKDAVPALASVWKDALSVKAIYTQTRAVEFIDLSITSFEADTINGVISLTVSGENLKDAFYLEQQDASAFLQISDGNSNISSEYVAMTPNYNIKFEDLQVKAICCKNWDTNRDGELSYSEAAVVTNIGTVFQGNINIFTFTELKYFTGLTEISESAFSGCVNLLKLEMPYSIIYISTSAFKNCGSLRYINIPNSVIEIKDSAFSGCISLQEIIIPNSVTSIGDSAFAGCTSTTKIVIPESVTDFGYYICKSCTGELCVECNIPDGKIDYSPSIFYNGVFADSGFDKIVISDKVTTVGDYAFYNCGKIRTIEIGENISNIGYYAFIQEISDEVLSSIFITALTPPSLSNNAFDYTWVNASYNFRHYTTPNNLTIYVPSASVDDYRAAWSYYSGRIVGYDFEKDIPVE